MSHNISRQILWSRSLRGRTAEVANRTQSSVVEVEIECSDSKEHRRRVEQRLRDEPELTGPTWRDVVSREYRAWDREHIVVDTAGLTTEQAVETLLPTLQSR